MPRVAIVHARPLVRFGLAAMLQCAPDVTLAAVSGSVDEVPLDSAGPPTDVLITAHSGPDDVGSDLVGMFAGRIPILTVCDSRHYDGASLQTRDGVFGTVTADVSPDELATAVRAVARRRRFLSRSLTRGLRDASRNQTWTLDGVRLSPRERQTLGLIAQGYTHHQVARRMGIAKTTVDTYVERIREKLSIGNKAELTLAAVSLLSPALSR